MSRFGINIAEVQRTDIFYSHQVVLQQVFFFVVSGKSRANQISTAVHDSKFNPLKSSMAIKRSHESKPVHWKNSNAIVLVDLKSTRWSPDGTDEAQSQ